MEILSSNNFLCPSIHFWSRVIFLIELNPIYPPAKPVMQTAPNVTTTTPVVSAPPAVPPPLTPQQLIQQQHAHQQAIQENEQFALAWLRATYEPCSAATK